MSFVSPPAPYRITEVNGVTSADDLNRINKMFSKDFLPLKERQLATGLWWLVYHEQALIGFAGAVPFFPFEEYGYFKRVAILKEHRGHGLQTMLIARSEERARVSTDWTHMISSCHFENMGSANSFIKAGYRLCEPERPWEPDSLFWIKRLQPAS